MLSKAVWHVNLKGGGREDAPSARGGLATDVIASGLVATWGKQRGELDVWLKLETVRPVPLRARGCAATDL